MEKERQILRFIFEKMRERGLVSEEEYRQLELLLVTEDGYESVHL